MWGLYRIIVVVGLVRDADSRFRIQDYCLGFRV